MRFTRLPRFSLGGLISSEIDAIFIRDPDGKGQHSLSLFYFPLKKPHPSLKVGAIFMSSPSGYLLGSQRGALRLEGAV